jgi:hypothetical protein
VRSNLPLGFRRGIGTDDVAEGLIRRGPLKSSRLPFPQIVLHAALNGSAKDHPRLPHGARHDTDAVELMMRVLRAIAAAHGHCQPDDVTAQFQSALRHRRGDDVRQQRIAGDDNIGPRDDRTNERARQSFEKIVQLAAILAVEDGEPRKRRPPMTVERRRNAPYAAPAFAKFCLLLFAVLDEPVWWIRYNGLDRAWLAISEPFKTVRQNESGFSSEDRTRHRTRPRVSDGSRGSGHRINSRPVCRTAIENIK